MALNVFTIAPDADFTAELVKAILDGFPMVDSKPPLETYSILVPNRRTARALREAFIREAKAAALLLPRIRPIGDLDDEDFDPLAGPDTSFGVLTPVGQHFALIKLVQDWTLAHPHLPLAESLRHSLPQVQALARSLSQLLDSLDIEEQDPAGLLAAVGFEFAAHQEALISLLQLVHRDLPALLADRKLISANRRRSELIRLYARQLKDEGAPGPVIAAGSTGTIPATRELLKTIASLPNGAIVLPGLDTGLDADCWKAVSPQHPQQAMKQLLEHIGVEPKAVSRLGPKPGPRAFLASELMRPSETTHEWATILRKSKSRILTAVADLDLIECRDGEEEAAVIAALVRLKLAENASDDIAIVTPDPVMARRVTAALQRFEIIPENSAGERLDAFGAANFLRLLIDLARQSQSVTALAALLHHPATGFGKAAAADLTLLRSPLMMLGFQQLEQLIEHLPEAIALRLHPKAQAPESGSPAWDGLAQYARQMQGSLVQLTGDEQRPLSQQLGALIALARSISTAELWLDEVAQKLQILVDMLADESDWHPWVTLAEAASLLSDYLARTSYRPRVATTPRVSIVGLLEARLQSFDVVILAGLSEAVWPGTADSGPWLNRPMRTELHIKQPEASIGQMAHDFAQSMGARELVLSWSREDAGQPRTPSRWLLRLKAVLKAAGVDVPVSKGAAWRAMTAALVRPAEDIRISIPSPRPPQGLRLSRLSITKVDTLIKDAYSVYASSILKLDPLQEIAEAGNYALRGNIFHLALAIFFKQHRTHAPADMEVELLKAGKEAFRLLPDAAVVQHSWWPRYRRAAAWLAGQAEYFYTAGAKLFAETDIVYHRLIGGRDFTLSGRADLIRLDSDNSFAIFDFKSGGVPATKETSAKFSHQLTLEAAILEEAGFGGRSNLKAGNLAYVEVSGGTPAGDSSKLKAEVIAQSPAHLAGLIQLLTDYMAEDQPFLPRANARPDYKGRHDHLSRYKEWRTRGAAS